MFRSIGGTLDKKKKDFIGSREKNFEISYVFNKFLNKHFTEYKNLFSWKIFYNPKNGKVVINTSSKLIAGELSLKIKELVGFLKEANLKVTQIIIA